MRRPSAQLELLRRLLPACPNLRAITYEDPRVDEDGGLVPSNREWLTRLAGIVGPWAAAPPAPTEPAAGPVSLAGDPPAQPDCMVELLHRAPELAELSLLVRRQVMTRSHRGTGTLVDAFPRTIEAWLELYPGDGLLDELGARFLASPAAAAWRESSDERLGQSLEEAFFHFAEAESIGDAATRRAEVAGAIVRALVVSPAPA